jgi:hypothetical protein
MEMRTFDAMHKAAGSCVYWGERGDWLVVAGRSRESDALEESNFRSILKRLGGEGDTVAVEHETHWAVGWVEHMLVHPDDAERVKIATDIHDALEGYPVVDEEDFSNLEHERFHDWAEGVLKRHGDDWETFLEEAREEHDNGGPGDEGWEAMVVESAEASMTLVGRVKRAVAKTDDSTPEVIDALLTMLLGMADEEAESALEAGKHHDMNRWSRIAHRLLTAQQEIAEM